MQQFNGNSFVAPIMDANLDHVPPYFVMPFFEYGDLTNPALGINQNIELAEQYFNRMIDCIEQLHSYNVFHRDIKPQNFLVGNGTLVVSDLGLCTEYDSPTAFTRTLAWGGTPRYMPPEYQNGGFRNADAAGDIYMLGLTFQDIICGGGPCNLPDALSVVIERATAYAKDRRYQSLAALRQSLSSAFDVVLGRVVGSGGVLSTLQSIVDRWTTASQVDSSEVSQFIDELILLPSDDQQRVCIELPREFFHVLDAALLAPGQLTRFIQSYFEMSEKADYPWSFAEVIASNMGIIFHSPFSSSADKADALRVAIVAAIRQNRFAAMDTCKGMIISVEDGGLAQRVFEVMIENPSYFMENIDPLTCRSPAIRQAIATLKANAAGVLQRPASGNFFPI